MTRKIMAMSMLVALLSTTAFSRRYRYKSPVGIYVIFQSLCGNSCTTDMTKSNHLAQLRGLNSRKITMNFRKGFGHVLVFLNNGNK